MGLENGQRVGGWETELKSLLDRRRGLSEQRMSEQDVQWEVGQ